jgi:hypothetical protein
MSKPRPVKAQQKKTATDFPSRKFETPLADPHAAEAGIVFPGGEPHSGWNPNKYLCLTRPRQTRQPGSPDGLCKARPDLVKRWC